MHIHHMAMGSCPETKYGINNLHKGVYVYLQPLLVSGSIKKAQSVKYCYFFGLFVAITSFRVTIIGAQSEDVACLHQGSG